MRERKKKKLLEFSGGRRCLLPLCRLLSAIIPLPATPRSAPAEWSLLDGMFIFRSTGLLLTRRYRRRFPFSAFDHVRRSEHRAVITIFPSDWVLPRVAENFVRVLLLGSSLDPALSPALFFFRRPIKFPLSRFRSVLRSLGLQWPSLVAGVSYPQAIVQICSSSGCSIVGV